MRTMLKMAAVCLPMLAGGLSPAGAAQAQDTAESIMARVAAHQDAAEAERAHYVYVQHAKMTSRKGKTVQCEELTDYRITPSGDGSHEELLKLEGRLRVKGRYITYNALEPDETSKGKDPKDETSKSKDSKERAKPAGSKDQAAAGKGVAEKDAAKDDDDAISVKIGEEGLDRDLVENMRKNLMHEKSKD